MVRYSQAKHCCTWRRLGWGLGASRLPRGRETVAILGAAGTASHDQSTATARPGHGQGTARARSQHDASASWARSEHDQSTATARRQHVTCRSFAAITCRTAVVPGAVTAGGGRRHGSGGDDRPLGVPARPPIGGSIPARPAAAPASSTPRPTRERTRSKAAVT